MQIAEAIAEQMGCEHEQRGNTALGERLGKAWGGYLGPANVAGFQEDGAADWLEIPGEENLHDTPPLV